MYIYFFMFSFSKREVASHVPIPQPPSWIRSCKSNRIENENPGLSFKTCDEALR